MSQKWHPPQSVLDKGLDGLHLSDVSLDTVATSSRYVFDSGTETEPIVPPIYHSSTYKLKSVDEYLKIIDEGGYIYSRLNTFTSDSVQACINNIEGGKGTLVFNSGMAAISTALFSFLKSGDHIVICNPCYSGAYDIVVNIFPKFNIEYTLVPSEGSVDDYKKSIKPNTRMLYGETPRNPTMAILDLEAFGALGRSLDNVITFVDGTFAGPYAQQPIKYGIDISMQSCTKYLGGHSDLTAGSLTFRTEEMWQTMIRYQTTYGSSLSAHDASLLLRGIKTLPIRMERHSSNAQKVAEYLEQHPKVVKVMYPGLPSHPDHEVAKKQMKVFSGMMSVEVKGGIEGGKCLAENLRLIHLAVSLGGVESLIEHPATMTHGPMLMSDEDRASGGITDGMVRISIGIEDPHDLIKDLEQALDKISDNGGYIYSRINTFTSDSMQACINNLEGGKGTLVFNSGMAAISTALFCFLKSGDHIVICNPCYSGAYDTVVNIFPKSNIEYTLVPSEGSVDDYKKSIKPNTRMLYGETPRNPTMAILDLEAFGALGRSLDNVITFVDGTFAGPYAQQPIKYGIDISMQSCTKYLGGHSDLTAGILTFRTEEMWQTVMRYKTSYGSTSSAHDASLLLRGIKTLPIRMERHSSNAQKVAEYLEQHPKNLRLIHLAVSLGGVESLIEHPATMTHGPIVMSDEDRTSGRITDGMVRISIGLEDPDYLINDLEQALDKISDNV